MNSSHLFSFLLILPFTVFPPTVRATGPDIPRSERDSVATASEAPMIDYKAPKPYILNDIEVKGIKYLDPEIVAASSGLVRGDTIYLPSEHVSQAIKRLWSQRYYSDVEIVARPKGDSVDLEIYLRERPRVYRWLFEGARKGEITDLTENLKLQPSTELSDYVLEKNKHLIRKFFSGKGFRNAEVTTRIENDSIIQNAVNVTFVIRRNRKVKIGEIVFDGNEVFSDKRLRRTLKKTHQKSINFLRSSKLKEADYEEDKENLIDFYNSQGYRNATITYDTIYPISDKRLGIRIGVNEGNKYYFRNVSWVGNSKYPTEYLQSLLGIEKGDLYDKKMLYKRLGIGKEANPEEFSVSSLYQNEGYLISQIDPAESIVGPDSIDLEIKIFEGNPFTINKVDISGNLRVNDEVIRRELYTRPGELYNRALVMQTIRQLNQMQHFNPESTMPSINPVMPGDMVDISWPLEETPSDKFELSGGWGAGMFVGSIGIQLNNLSIRNFFKKGAWRPYPAGQSQQFTIRAQSNGTYYKSFLLSFTEPWLGGKKPNSLTVSAHYSDETDAVYAWQRGNKHFRTMGLAVGIGRRLTWPDQYFTLYNELSYQAYNMKDWNYFLFTNGTSHIITLRTVLSRSSIDQPIYPRRGSEFSLSLALTPPYSLFDGKDYSDPKMSDKERYKWIEYHKWELKARWFYPLSANGNLVLMARAQMGYLGSYNKNKLSPFEGFDVGGSGMTGYNVYGVDVIGLRGYADGSLTPYSSRNDYARVYNKYTVELRYPFILKPTSQIFGLIFAEGGNAFSSWKTFNPFELKRSLGVGVRLYLPVVGLIGVDWGWGFDRAVGETRRHGSEIHFLIGMEF